MPAGYVTNWTAVALAGAIGVSAVMVMFLVNALLAPRRKSDLKGIPYECGIVPAPYTWSQMQIRYYVFAIDFLIFDIEAVFLFPWAMIFLKQDAVVFYAMVVFIALLFFGIVYGWRKGVLQWR
ncbi:MAG: NADH-quinone oxidoreductase subunit A [Dehalococcoidia bacterium]|nr:NADH-quinone oxidoreductase subunit A [Dehalococcoidia bacterium]